MGWQSLRLNRYFLKCYWHWHQLDLIIVRQAALKSVLHTRSYHSADCDELLRQCWEEGSVPKKCVMPGY